MSSEQSETILLVDDEEDIRLMLEDVLSVHFRVLTANDGVHTPNRLPTQQAQSARFGPWRAITFRPPCERREDGCPVAAVPLSCSD